MADYNNEKDKRVKVRMLQWIGSTVLIYIIVTSALNYLMINIKGIGKNAGGINEPEFTLKDIFVPLKFDWLTLLMCAAIAGIFIVLKLDTQWRIKNGNKTVKGEAHYMETKDIAKILYAVPENTPEKAEKSGIPLYRENGTVYMDIETIHSLVIGTTRSGKGQTFVLPMIRHIGMSKAKHSMVINDPKGELVEYSYKMLKEQGYEVVVLNLRDTQLSNLWNPLQIIIDEYRDRRDNKNGNSDLSRCIKLCQALANVFTHNEKSDPIWPESAQSLFVAMLLYMLEQGYDNGHLENVSLYSLYQMFVEFGTESEAQVKKGANKYINALDELFRSLPIGNPARSAYATSNFAEGDMRASIFSTLASNLRLFGSDVGVSKITSGNQINFKGLINPDKPMAIFMVVPDNETSRYVLASLFINQCYDELVEYASKEPAQKLKQRVHFILDEFGNMVHIPDMDTKITVAAGRNILFNMFIQDFNQLDTKYGDTAKTIRSNCGNLIYINSLDKDTNEYFSAVLGNKTVEYTTYSGELNSWLSNQSGVVDSQPLITADKLSNMPMGSVIVKRQRCWPMRSEFEMFYKLGIEPTSQLDISKEIQLIDHPLSDTIYPLNEMWAAIIRKKSFGPTEKDQQIIWSDKADELFNDDQVNWTWQIESTKNNVITMRPVRKSYTKKSIRTDFAVRVDINDEISEALELIEKRDKSAYLKLSANIEQLSKDIIGKKEIAEKSIAIIRKQRYVHIALQDKLIKYVNSFHNAS